MTKKRSRRRSECTRPRAQQRFLRPGQWHGVQDFVPPQLTIVLSGVPPTGIILSWPTNVAGFDYSGFTLQSTTNLGSPAVWTTNSPAPVVIAGQNTVTNPLSGPQEFYRLLQ